MINFLKERKIWILVLGFSFFLLVLEALRPQKQSSDKKSEESFNVDTVIPPGHVLVPIQIQNLENLNALLGQMGVVDLWTYNFESQKKSKKIATQVRLIRAPLDPSVFAIMVKEEESRDILEHGDQFYVTVHRPDTKRRIPLQLKKKQKFEIETFSEGDKI